MRDIKFRVWHEPMNFMYYDVNVIFKKDFHEKYGEQKIAICPVTHADIKIFVSNDHECLMQYTGEKDKDNNEIYEGDIVKGFIEWDAQANYLIEGQVIFRSTSFKVGDVILSKLFNCKVVGNIYENPELMEKKE